MIGAELFVNVNGGRNSDIRINNVNAFKTKQQIKLGHGVKENAVKVELTK